MLMSSINSINIYSIDGIVDKPSISTFQNSYQIENQLNIKKVLGKNVYVICISSVNIRVFSDCVLY